MKLVLHSSANCTRTRAAALRQVINRDGPWRAVTEALLADPMGAALDVTVPDVPEPDEPARPLVPPPPDEIKMMLPGGGYEVLTEAEVAQRAKAARASPVSAAMREMEAVERARCGAG